MNARNIIFIVTLTLASGCSIFGIRTAEELSYSVVEDTESVEVRRYAPYISAEASMEGDYEAVQSDLFRALAGYIFGKNTTKEDIAMTAPVVMNSQNQSDTNVDSDAPSQSVKSETIEMTAPVTMTPESERQWKMAFSMPSKYTMETLPKPTDKRVKLVPVAARTVAVVRYSGTFNDDENRDESLSILQTWLKDHPEYIMVGKPFFAGYDPPFTLPFLRRNEVLIEIKPK